MVAGEASGDLHGSNLIRNLSLHDKEAKFRCFGGDLMKNAGAEIAFHYKEMSFIGIMEVLKNIRTINHTLQKCKQDILEYNPDVVIMIDYPGFNLKIAEFAKLIGFKTIYYIAPKVWASRKSRIKRIRRSVDKLYVILPFEEEYFNSHGCKAEYIGNPLADAVAAYNPKERAAFLKENDIGDKPIVALLAGSRTTEIDNCLISMINACKGLEQYELVLAGAPSISAEYYQKYIRGTGIRMVYNKTYDLLSHSYAAVVVSGTATLETALFKVPEVVFYRVNNLTYLIGRPFVHIKFFSLVNIIMDKEIVKEYLQFNLSIKIRKELERLLSDNIYRNHMIENFNHLAEKIGKPGVSDRAAKSIVNFLNQNE